MMTGIRNVAVIGAGVMGSGIAAHAANAGAKVTLLDIKSDLAVEGVAKQLKAGGFTSARFAERVRTGSVGDDLDFLADADWIIEAVAERLDIKQDLYRKIASVCKPDAIISSNTSTIPLSDLTKGLASDFAERFLIAHFFNPPRRMRLLELVAGPETNPQVVQEIRDYADVFFGKSIVMCKDTPGFIANRVGTYWMLAAESEAFKAGLGVEEADALMGAPFGIPSSGIFGLFDLIGIDLMVSIQKSLQSALPESDEIQAIAKQPDLVATMVREGSIGRKSGAGFYKVSPDRKTREVVDLETGSYRPQRNARSDAFEAARAGPRALMEHPSAGGRYASAAMQKTLAYAAALVPEIADSPYDVDQAMMLGYAWKQGPFALIDALGAKWFADHLRAHAEPVPEYLDLAAEIGSFYRFADGNTECLLPDGTFQQIVPAEGIITVPAIRTLRPPVLSAAGADLWDMGDGVALIELHGKMNALSSGLIAGVSDSLNKACEEFSAVIIGTGAPNFSVGADLKEFLSLVEAGEIAAIADHIDRGQALMRAIKFAPIPVVPAASGLALGGGCELLLHSAATAAHVDLNAGLVEKSVGLVPGWGGCKEMLLHFSRPESGKAQGPVAPAQSAFDAIFNARRSTSAEEARDLGFLSDRARIVMNIERVLGQAKHRALELAQNYTPPEPRNLILSGTSGASALRNVLESKADSGRLSAHDRVVGEALISVLTGGPSADPAAPVTEDEVFALEREAFLELFGTPSSIERIRHMMATGKPLRN